MVKDAPLKALSDTGSGPHFTSALSNASAKSWQIEAAGPISATSSAVVPLSDPGAAEEGARLRQELEAARQLHAELEISSGETIRALRLQVRSSHAQT
jgi:hypothetical protein